MSGRDGGCGQTWTWRVRAQHPATTQPLGRSQPGWLGRRQHQEHQDGGGAAAALVVGTHTHSRAHTRTYSDIICHRIMLLPAHVSVLPSLCTRATVTLIQWTCTLLDKKRMQFLLGIHNMYDRIPYEMKTLYSIFSINKDASFDGVFPLLKSGNFHWK